MAILFWIFWVIDLFILLICLYETFLVSSNSSLAVPSLIVGGLLAGGLWFRAESPKIALTLVSLPAILAILYLIVYMIAGSKSNWR